MLFLGTLAKLHDFLSRIKISLIARESEMKNILALTCLCTRTPMCLSGTNTNTRKCNCETSGSCWSWSRSDCKIHLYANCLTQILCSPEIPQKLNNENSAQILILPFREAIYSAHSLQLALTYTLIFGDNRDTLVCMSGDRGECLGRH